MDERLGKWRIEDAGCVGRVFQVRSFSSLHSVTEEAYLLLPDRTIYQLMKSAIIPRPIAFISSTSEDGIDNLAPFRSARRTCFHCAQLTLDLQLLQYGSPWRYRLLRIEEPTTERHSSQCPIQAWLRRQPHQRTLAATSACWLH